MKDVVIVDAVRTPMGRSKEGVFRNVRAEDLSAHLIRTLLDRHGALDPAEMDSPEGWQVAAHMPISPPNNVSVRCYNGLVAVGEEALWVVGGSVSASQPRASRPDDRLPMKSCWAYWAATGEWSRL